MHLFCSRASTCTSHEADTWVRMALRSVPSLSSQPFLLLTPNLDFYPSHKCHLPCIRTPPLTSATCWSQCTRLLTLGSGNVSARQRPRQEHNTRRSWSFLAHRQRSLYHGGLYWLEDRPGPTEEWTTKMTCRAASLPLHSIRWASGISVVSPVLFFCYAAY